MARCSESRSGSSQEPYLMAFSISSLMTVATARQLSRSLKTAAKQLRTAVRRSSTFDHSLRTGKSMTRRRTDTGALLYRTHLQQAVALHEHPHGVEAQLLPLEVLVVDEHQGHLPAPGVLDEVNQGGDRRRVEVLEALEVHLHPHSTALRSGLENVAEIRHQKLARVTSTAPPLPGQFDSHGAGGDLRRLDGQPLAVQRNQHEFSLVGNGKLLL